VSRSASVALLIAIAIAQGTWQMTSVSIAASILKGFLLSLDIGLILLAALWFLNILNLSQVFVFFKHALSDITTDKRFQAILLGWFGVAIIEGASGFGTPILLIAPLMVSMGFKPLTSVLVCLIGDSITSVYGASGVPVTLGMVEGLSQLATPQIISMPLMLAFKATLFMITGSFIPLIITLVVSQLELGSWKKAHESWPFAILSGTLFSGVALVTTSILGPELPSLVAGLTGLIIMSVYAATHPNKRDQVEEILEKFYTKRDLAKALFPYVLIIALLSLSRATYLNIGDFLRSSSVELFLLGTNITHSFNLLYSPALILAIATFLCVYLYKLHPRDVAQSFKEALVRMAKPYVSLTLLLMLVTLLRYSGTNNADLAAIPQYLGNALSQYSIGSGWLLAAPFVGAFGAFLAGSVTVSNMMLSQVQVNAGISQGLRPELVLSLQSLGAGLGNMVALHNIIAGLTVVKAPGSLSKILIINALIATLLLSLTGIAALLLWGL
jgi:lactate permease